MSRDTSIRDILFEASDKKYFTGSVDGNAVNIFSGNTTSRSDITNAVNYAYKTIDTVAKFARDKTDSLFDMLAETTIENFCDFNTKNYQLMQRLMALNLNEKNITLNSLGTDSMYMGDSTKITNTAPSYSYASGRNYVYDYTKNLDQEGNVEKTRSISVTANNHNNSYTNHNELYQTTVNQYPDDNSTGVDKFTEDQKWNLSGNKNSLLCKTKQLFEMKRINTIISRFHTDTTAPIGIGDKKSVYGLSHGRNLLTKSAETEKGTYPTNGYDNPYCRVWTHHYQYDKYSKLIRPFYDGDNDKNKKLVLPSDFNNWKSKNSEWTASIDLKKSEQYVETSDSLKLIKKSYSYSWKDGEANPGWKHSVMDAHGNGNGMPNITPKYLGGGAKNIHTRDCMFSIENLAWKGYDPYSFEQALSWEQRGPNGGRIMWFPPYGISFNESVSTQWKSNSFIGRGEDVYTYVNTTRQGTLNFMLVVDHPSIIDYVTWNEANLNGNDGVKDTDILRFFAGCDADTLRQLAKPTPLTDEYVDQSESQDANEEVKEEQVPEPIPETSPAKDYDLTFYVFYPNNYSGTYDHTGNTVEAIAYLLAGRGAQKKEGTTKKDITADIPLTFDSLDDYDKSEQHGYEMGTDIGISAVVKTDTEPYNIINGTNKLWQKIAKESPKRTEYIIDTQTPRKWRYRIDGEYVATTNDYYRNCYDQKLVRDNNYLDNASFKLNASHENVKTTMNDNSDHLYSLAEIAYVLTEDDKVKERIQELSLIDTESDRMKEIEEIFEDDGYKIDHMSGIGYSNSHGSNANKQINNNRNDLLAKQRCETVFDWLNLISEDKFLDGRKQEIEVEAPQESVASQSVQGKTSVDDIEAKKWRSAKITIHFKNNTTTKVSETQQTEVVGKTEDNEDIVAQEQTTFVGFKLTNPEKCIYTDDATGRQWIHDEDSGTMKLYFSGGDDYGKYTAENGYDTNTQYSSRTTAKGEAKINSTKISGDTNKLRYDQEYHFFKKLEKDHKVIFDKLTDKLQYFDPAFHSMTPEGFNGRLTFLHQCTRQGNTVGVSDYDAKSANNLAFGRAPYCVLRLGDFYHQMIIINNMSLDFQPLVWDINTENAGIQPMICNVSLSITLIGGGDIGGAIRRLQNAMSFNYYANTSLYDNRADRVDHVWDEHTAQNTEADKDYTFYNTKMKK